MSDPVGEPPTPVWDRPPPARRRTPLTREIVVAAAIPIADAEGLAAVTVRRLAAELDARPMSVYSYARITSKEELFDLMVDEVSAEMLLPELPPDWREALRSIAIRCRQVLLRHPWWVELVGQHVLLGPNGTRYREQNLDAVGGLGLDPESRLAIYVAVQSYVVGQAMFTLDEEASTPAAPAVGYQAALIASGDFPNLAGLDPHRPTTPEAHEQFFRRGLDWLLRGIAASIEPPAG
jgi:AcrR family transcriptional regulator